MIDAYTVTDRTSKTAYTDETKNIRQLPRGGRVIMHSERRGSGIKQLRLPAFQLRFCPSPKHRSSLCAGSPNPDSRNDFDPDFLRAWHRQLKIVVRPVIPQYRFDKTKKHTLKIVTTYSSARTILCVLFVYSPRLLLHPNHIPFLLCFWLPNPDIFS